MYSYTAEINIMENPNYVNIYWFSIVIRGNIYFKVGKCYVMVNKMSHGEFSESDTITVRYYSNGDSVMDVAKKEIENSLNFFSYFSGTPFDMNYQIFIEPTVEEPVVDISQSAKKMTKIKNLNDQYLRINQKKRLMDEVLKFYATAIRYNFMFQMDTAEEMFFLLFKIIERIAKDDFSHSRDSINKGESVVFSFVEKMVQDIYGLESTDNRKSELAAVIGKQLFDLVFDANYHIIMWYLKKNAISIDAEKIAKMVKVRNTLAHGNVIDKEQVQELIGDVFVLANKAIKLKFFTNVDVKVLEFRTNE